MTSNGFVLRSAPPGALEDVLGRMPAEPHSRR
jgi:hypothetical protein